MILPFEPVRSHDEATRVPDRPVPVALALGSNLGDRTAHLAAAVTVLREVVEMEAVSSVYASEAVGYRDQPEFLNAVVVGTTRLAPRALLEAALAAEAAAGRRRTRPDGPRSLDVDLILYGDRLVRAPDLVVPHPRWRERGFVLAPLTEVACDWIDPETGLTVGVLAAGAEQRAGRPGRVASAEVIAGTSPHS